MARAPGMHYARAHDFREGRSPDPQSCTLAQCTSAPDIEAGAGLATRMLSIRPSFWPHPYLIAVVFSRSVPAPVNSTFAQSSDDDADWFLARLDLNATYGKRIHRQRIFLDTGWVVSINAPRNTPGSTRRQHSNCSSSCLFLETLLKIILFVYLQKIVILV